MDEPNFTQRPPHIPAARWNDPRVSWHARRQVTRAWLRENRPVDREYRPEQPVTPPPVPKGNGVPRHDRVAAVELCLEAGMTARQIVAEMGVKAGTIVRALERCGRRDLIPEFDQLRKIELRRAA